MFRLVIIFSFFIFLDFLSLSEAFPSNWKRYRSEQFFKKGFYYFNQKDYILASKYFLKAVKYNFSNYKMRYWLAKSYYYSGYVIHARNEFIYLLDAVDWEDLNLKQEFKNFFSSIYSEKEKVSQFYDFSKYVKSHYVVKSEKVYDPLYNRYVKHIYYPTSIYFDSSYYHYWIVGYGSNNVVVINRNGFKKFILERAGNTLFNGPYDVVISPDRHVYISDSNNHQIHKYKIVNSNLKFKYLYSIGEKKNLSYPKFKNPKGLAIDVNGFLYVVDSGNNQIQKLDMNGNLIFTFGGKNSIIKSKYPLKYPSDILICDSYIYISDTGNNQIKVYDTDGNWVENIGELKLKNPMGLKRISKYKIVIADTEMGLWIFNTKTSELIPIENEYIFSSDNESKKSIIDIALGANGIFYTLNSYQSTLSAFILDKIKYSNLNVNVINSFIKYYHPPLLFELVEFFLNLFSGFKKLYREKAVLTHVVEVKDYLGNPVYGLNESNFKVYNNQKKISSKKIKVLSKKESVDKHKIIVLNEQSKNLVNYANYYQIFIKKFLNSMKHVDIEWINYNQFYYLQNNYREKNFVKNIVYQANLSSQTGALGEALHVAISKLLRSKNKIKSIFLFYSGKFSHEDFSKYSIENNIYYAKNNHIPIYIFSFNKSQTSVDSFMKLLSDKTNGEYIDVYSKFSFKNFFIKRLQNLQGIYYIQYGINVYPKTVYQWNQLDIYTNFFNIFGKATSGYFLQEK